MILLQHGGTLTTLARTFILKILSFCFEHIISLVKPLKEAGKKVPNQEACIEIFLQIPSLQLGKYTICNSNLDY